MIYIICLLEVFGVIGVDMLSKYLVVKYEADTVIIPELLKFKLTYNPGASFSFLADKSWARVFFIILTSIICILLILAFVYVYVKKRKVSTWLMVAMSLIFAGAIGNLTDRIILGEVRDFIFVFYNTEIFPAIFNVADISLVVGVIMVCVYTLFLDKDAIFKKKEKNGN